MVFDDIVRSEAVDFVGTHIHGAGVEATGNGPRTGICGGGQEARFWDE